MTRDEVAQILGSRFQFVCHVLPLPCVESDQSCVSLFVSLPRCSRGGPRQRFSPGSGGLPGGCADHGQ